MPVLLEYLAHFRLEADQAAAGPDGEPDGPAPAASARGAQDIEAYLVSKFGDPTNGR